jgi:hypothetical protein
LKYDIVEANNLYRGKSILHDYNKDQFITVLPNLRSPTGRMVLTNDKYKVHILIDEDGFYESNTFKIIDIHDVKDKKITDPTERDTVINNVEGIFSEALMYIFPKDF